MAKPNHVPRVWFFSMANTEKIHKRTITHHFSTLTLCTNISKGSLKKQANLEESPNMGGLRFFLKLVFNGFSNIFLKIYSSKKILYIIGRNKVILTNVFLCASLNSHHFWSILCRENKNKNFHLNIFSCQILSFHYMWRILYRECIDKVFLLNVLMHVSLNVHPVWKIFYIEYMDKLLFCVKDCGQRVQR